MNGSVRCALVLGVAALLGAGGALTLCAWGASPARADPAGPLAWGANDSGQLGDANAPNNASAPVAVAAGAIPPGTTITQVAVGHQHTLALSSGGQVYSWGKNTNG